MLKVDVGNGSGEVAGEVGAALDVADVGPATGLVAVPVGPAVGVEVPEAGVVAGADVADAGADAGADVADAGAVGDAAGTGTAGPFGVLKAGLTAHADAG